MLRILYLIDIELFALKILYLEKFDIVMLMFTLITLFPNMHSAPRLAKKMVLNIGFCSASGSARKSQLETPVEIYHDLL